MPAVKGLVTKLRELDEQLRAEREAGLTADGALARTYWATVKLLREAREARQLRHEQAAQKRRAGRPKNEEPAP